MAEKLSVILLNSHPSFTDPVPSVQQMIDIGGYHVEKPKPLPKVLLLSFRLAVRSFKNQQSLQDLQKFMDDAKEGVVLFSLGSNLKSSQLPPEKRDAILKVLSKLKQKVLWKWETDVLPGQPPNVKLSKWLPQNDIMGKKSQVT